MHYSNDKANKMFQLYKENVYVGYLTYTQIEKMKGEIDSGKTKGNTNQLQK